MGILDVLRVLREAANENPATMSLFAVDLAFPSLSKNERDELKTALLAASIPHWCDNSILAALLQISEEECAARSERLARLSVVEPFTARGNGVINVHEASRLALRKAMATGQKDRFRKLSSDAARCFENDSMPAGRVEWVYHLLSAEPERGADALESLHRDWMRIAHPEDFYALSVALSELENNGLLNGRARAWVLIVLAQARQVRGETAQLEASAQQIIELARSTGDERALGEGYALLGDALEATGKLNDSRIAYEEYLTISQRLATKYPDNAGWQLDLAAAFNRVGCVLEALGLQTEAEEAFRKDLEIGRRLVAKDPGQASWQSDLAATCSQIGGIFASQGKLAEARTALEESMAIRQRLADSDPSNADWQAELAEASSSLGALLESQGNLTDALKAFRKALAISKHLVAVDSHHPGWQLSLATNFNRLGGALEAQGKLAEAQAAFSEDLVISQKLAKRDPSNVEWQSGLATTYNRVGGLLEAQGKLSLAMAAYEEALSIRQRLAEQEPNNVDWQSELAATYSLIGGLLESQGKLTLAMSTYRETLVITQRLSALAPANTEWESELAAAFNRIGGVYESQRKLVEAEEAFTKALEITKRLTERDPSNMDWQSDLAAAYNRLGGVYESNGNLADALTALRTDLAISKRLAEQEPTNVSWQSGLAVTCSRLGEVLALDLKLDEAMVAHREAIAIRRKLIEHEPTNANWQSGLATAYNRFGVSLQSEGKQDEAMSAYQSALSIFQKLVEQAPTSATWQAGLAVTHERIAEILGAEGKLSDALASCQSSLAIRQRLAEQDPVNANWQVELAETYERIGDLLDAEGKVSDATAARRSALTIRERLLEQEPGNVLWQSALSAARSKIGGSMVTNGKVAKALQPMLVHFVFHPKSKAGEKLAQYVHQQLNDDVVVPGLRVPTVFCPRTEHLQPPAMLNLDLAEHSFVVPLADDELCLDADWSRFVADVWQACDSSEQRKHRCVPMQLSKAAWPLDDRLKEVNFGRAFAQPDEGSQAAWVTRRIVVELCRFLQGLAATGDRSPAPTKLFLSHAKADLNTKPCVAMQMIELLKGDQPVDTWVDSGDIDTGSRFTKAIENGVQQTSVLAVLTDNYSSREWCREEVMLAKENQRPIVVVDALMTHEVRSFPFLDNVPRLRWNDNPQAAIDLLLKETLRHLHAKAVLERSMQPGDTIFVRPPEPLMLLGVASGSNILYPDPPLGVGELKRLRRSNATFSTPLERSAQDRPLDGRLIALSMSESSDIARWGFDELHLKQTMLELSRHLLIRGASLGYGGHLGEPGYTRKLFELVRTHNNSDTAQPFQRIINHYGWPLPALATSVRAELSQVATIIPIPRPSDIDETLDKDLVAEIPGFLPGNKSAQYRFAWCRGMTEMRAFQADRSRSNVSARIVLGGTFSKTVKVAPDGSVKESWYSSRMPGVLEEVLLSIKAAQPVFLIGAFGGVAKMVIDLLQSRGHPAASWDVQSQAPFAPETRDLYASRGQKWWYYDQEPRIANLLVDDDRSIVDFLADAWKPHAELGWETCLNPLTRDQNQELFETIDLARMVELIQTGMNALK